MFFTQRSSYFMCIMPHNDKYEADTRGFYGYDAGFIYIILYGPRARRVRRHSTLTGVAGVGSRRAGRAAAGGTGSKKALPDCCGKEARPELGVLSVSPQQQNTHETAKNAWRLVQSRTRS